MNFSKWLLPAVVVIFGCAGPVVCGGDIATVNVLIDSKNFVPLRMGQGGVPPSWRGCKTTDIMSKLKKTKPAGIKKEPPLRPGSEHLYGYMELGTKKNNKYYFVLDVPEDHEKSLLYFDANQNGNLADDGEPFHNEGSFKASQGFATQIELPWRILVENAPFEGNFYIWFIINSNQWAASGFTHYSMVQLRGTVDLGGTLYTAIIADRGETDNNVDFEHDGLFLKKQNGHGLQGGNLISSFSDLLNAMKKKGDVIYVSDEEARAGVVIDGKTHIINVSYAPIASAKATENHGGAVGGDKAP